MTVYIPRVPPTRGAAMQKFEIQRVDYLSPETGGRLGAVTAGFPLWTATWSLGAMGETSSDAWRAFVLGQRGAQRLFIGSDMARPFPYAYRFGFNGMTTAAGQPFTGAAAGWSQTIDSDLNCDLSLTGLPAGLILSLGDYVDFRWGTFQRSLVRVIVPAVADGTGAATVTVEPPIPSLTAPAAVAHLDNPGCLMRLTKDTDVGQINRLKAISGTIAAVQDLYP